MGQTKSLDLPEPGTSSPSATVSSRSRWWLWALVLGAVAVGGWYYRDSKNGSRAADPAAPAAAGKGRGGFNPANMVVSVVVATAQRGDLPVYFNGLGTVTAFNTVTVRSRVDGQLISIAFKEGQFVHEGDLLAQIDPRPYQVQLEQAMGQLAKDQAQRKDAEVNYERYKLLFKEGVIPQQQLDTQAALVGQFDGAIASDQSQIDNAKLQLTYSRITAPISGRIGLRLVDAGNIVHASDTNGLLVITQLQPISVIFSLPQDQLPEVNAKLYSGVQLVVDAYDRDDTEKIATGKPKSIPTSQVAQPGLVAALRRLLPRVPRNPESRQRAKLGDLGDESVTAVHFTAGRHHASDGWRPTRGLGSFPPIAHIRVASGRLPHHPGANVLSRRQP